MSTLRVCTQPQTVKPTNLEINSIETGKKIYRITAIIDCDTKKLANKLADTSDLTNWNKTLVKHQQIKVR